MNEANNRPIDFIAAAVIGGVVSLLPVAVVILLVAESVLQAAAEGRPG